MADDTPDGTHTDEQKKNVNVLTVCFALRVFPSLA